MRRIAWVFLGLFGIFFTETGGAARARPALGSLTSRGLCYSTVESKVRPFTKNFLEIQLPPGRRHSLALDSSKIVYRLADLDSATSGEELIQKHATFHQSIPKGYVFSHYGSDRESGLKYMILEATDPQLPWIFAFAGTETMKDWLVDLKLGRAQLAKAENLLRTFTDCEFTGEDGEPMSQHSWIITGHSLGGGLAQAFAYEIQRRREELKLRVMPLELVTFNAFGAASVVSDEGISEEAIGRLNATNYFVTGDPISMIGRHIGRTLELKFPQVGTLDFKEMMKRHDLLTVRVAANRFPSSPFGFAIPAAPPHATILNQLAQFAQYLPLSPSLLSAGMTEQDRHIQILEEAARILMSRGAPEPFDSVTSRYIIHLVELFEIELFPIGQPKAEDPVKTTFLERLQKIGGILVGSKGRWR